MRQPSMGWSFLGLTLLIAMMGGCWTPALPEREGVIRSRPLASEATEGTARPVAPQAALGSGTSVGAFDVFIQYPSPKPPASAPVATPVPTGPTPTAHPYEKPAPRVAYLGGEKHQASLTVVAGQTVRHRLPPSEWFVACHEPGQKLTDPPRSNSHYAMRPNGTASFYYNKVGTYTLSLKPAPNASPLFTTKVTVKKFQTGPRPATAPQPAPTDHEILVAWSHGARLKPEVTTMRAGDSVIFKVEPGDGRSHLRILDVAHQGRIFDGGNSIDDVQVLLDTRIKALTPGTYAVLVGDNRGTIIVE